jgi:CRP-like cAMP-binding protein
MEREIMGVDAALLRRLSPFSSISEVQLGKLAELCEEKTVSAGQTLFREGEPGIAIFVVPEGDIEVLITAGGDSVFSIEWVGADDVLGIRAFFPPYRYMTTARSLTEGCVLAIDAIKLRELFEQDSYLAISVHECLMQAMLNRVTSLRSKT